MVYSKGLKRIIKGKESDIDKLKGRNGSGVTLSFWRQV